MASGDRSAMGVGRVPGLRGRHAGPGPVRTASARARGIAARGRRLERRLDRCRTGLRRAGVGLGGQRGRPGLPGRLPDREEPLGRQHLPVRRHLLRAGDPGALPAPRAHVRHHRRAAHAGRVHRRGHRPARRYPPGDLRLRRDPARGRGQHAPRRQPCRAPGAARAARPAAGAAGRRPAARPAVPGQGRRPPDRHPAAGGARGGRDRRRDLRRRFHPGGARRHHRPVHRLHVQRVRPARHARAVLPAGRGGGPDPLPAAGPGGDPRGRRGQAAARRRMGAARLVRARVHRRGARPSSPSLPSAPTAARPAARRRSQRSSQVSGRRAAAASAPRDRAPAPAPEGSNRADAQRRASAAAPPAARR